MYGHDRKHSIIIIIFLDYTQINKYFKLLYSFKQALILWHREGCWEQKLKRADFIKLPKANKIFWNFSQHQGIKSCLELNRLLDNRFHWRWFLQFPYLMDSEEILPWLFFDPLLEDNTGSCFNFKGRNCQLYIVI